MKDKEYTEAELRQFARKLKELHDQGYQLRIAWLCGREGHRHRWRFTAWLCGLLDSIYIGGSDG